MRLFFYLALLCVLILTSIGCSSRKDPTTPSVDRELNAFATAMEIFGPNTSEDDEPVEYDFNPLYHDVALAQLVQYAGHEYEEDHGCIAVTLNREDNDPANPFKPVFRWLDSENGNTSESPIFYVTFRDDFNPGNNSDYRALACDAIYVPEGSNIDNIENDSIEVVVAYMVRDRWQDDDNWDIEVTAIQWTDITTTDDYWTREPDYRLTYVFSDMALDERDEWNPDIAYYRGPLYSYQRYGPTDVYLAYTDQEDAGGNEQHINWRHYIRETDTISNELRAQTLDGHNGYDPSIDVGLIDVGVSSLPWVAIAYTSQFQNNHTGYHVCVSAWPVNDLDMYGDKDHNTLISLQNPNHTYRDAGLPCLDIAPDWNADNVAALSYTQVTSADGFGPTTATYVVRFLGNLADLNTHILVEDTGDPDFADTLYSSIAINLNQSTGTDIYASLAFMAQDTDVDITDNWHPRVALMRILDTSSPYFEGVTWCGWADTAGGGPYTILGNYNLSDIPFQNPGISIAIVTDPDDNYWAAWNDRIEMEPPPEEVWASYGFAG